ncbi:MAG: RNA 3'-terminal phosphate cyclase [Janthinobacterium lividum]
MSRGRATPCCSRSSTSTLPKCSPASARRWSGWRRWRHRRSRRRDYIGSGAAVGEYLADQLILPMALAGSGRFTVAAVSRHALTNAEVITRFLPEKIVFERSEWHSTCVVRSTCGGR